MKNAQAGNVQDFLSMSYSNYFENIGTLYWKMEHLEAFHEFRCWLMKKCIQDLSVAE